MAATEATANYPKTAEIARALFNTVKKTPVVPMIALPAAAGIVMNVADAGLAHAQGQDIPRFPTTSTSDICRLQIEIGRYRVEQPKFDQQTLPQASRRGSMAMDDFVPCDVTGNITVIPSQNRFETDISEPRVLGQTPWSWAHDLLLVAVGAGLVEGVRRAYINRSEIKTALITTFSAKDDDIVGP